MKGRLEYRCRTSLDRWQNTVWPDNFVYAPRIGESIEGRGPGDLRPVLQIVDIRHTIYESQPCVILILHDAVTL